MAGMCIDFQSIHRTQAKYQEENIQYNRTAMMAEIKRLFPDDVNPDLNDPKYSDIVKSLPYAPTFMGDLAHTMGLNGKVLTSEMWEEISHGYLPSRFTSDPAMLEKAKSTPRGDLIQVAQNSSKITDDGKFESPEKAISSTEFVFGMGGNINKVLARMGGEDPQVIMKFKAELDRIFSQHIIPEMTKSAIVRKGSGGEIIGYAKEILAVPFFHIENRGAVGEDGVHRVEPYFHVHLDVMNIALARNGDLNSLSSAQMTARKSDYNTIFQREMKAFLEKEFGFKFVPVYSDRDKNNDDLKDYEKQIVSYDLPDHWVPEKIREHYSRRSQEMDKAKNGKKGFIADELARLATRESKEHQSPTEMFSMWKKEMNEFGWDISAIQKKQDFDYSRPNIQSNTDEQLVNNFLRVRHQQHVEKYGPVQCYLKLPNLNEITLEQKIAMASGFGGVINEDQLMKNFFRKHGEISFNEGQFKSFITLQLLGDFDAELAERHAERMFSEQCVQMMDKERIGYYESFIKGEITDPELLESMRIRWNKDIQFTTKSVIKMETEICSTLKAKENITSFKFDRESVKAFITDFELRQPSFEGKPFKFNKDQRNAIFASLCENGAYLNLTGRAGAGKSTLLKCVKEYVEERDFKFYGASISSAATDNLAKSCELKRGAYENIAKTIIELESGKLKWTDKTIVCIDEMGMIDLEACHKIIKWADHYGAKIIGSGEKEQLQNVGLGSSYRILNDRFISVSVNQIQRQRDAWQRDMVENFAVGNSKFSMRTMHDRGFVKIDEKREGSISSIVNDYLKDPTSDKKKLIMAGTNHDVNMLNLAVMDELRKSGKLSSDPKDSITIRCRDREERINREFTIGQRIVFTKNTKSSDVEQKTLKNSQTGEIIGFKSNRLKRCEALIIRMDNGEETFIKTDSLPAMNHGYASTVHRSQGQTKFNSYWFVSDMQNLHSAYVSASRHTNECRIYLSKEQAEKWVDRMEGKPPTAKMVEVATWIAKKEGITLAPEITESFIECRSYLNKAYQEYDKRGIEAQHPLDDFINIIESMSKSAYKKSSFDYQVIDGEISGAYQHHKELREQEIAAHQKQKIEKAQELTKPEIKPAKPQEPESPVKAVVKNDGLTKAISRHKKELESSLDFSM